MLNGPRMEHAAKADDTSRSSIHGQLHPDPNTWGVDAVALWLQQNNLSKFIDIMKRYNFEGANILNLSTAGIKVLGKFPENEKRALLKAVQTLKKSQKKYLKQVKKGKAVAPSSEITEPAIVVEKLPPPAAVLDMDADTYEPVNPPHRANLSASPPPLPSPRGMPKRSSNLAIKVPVACRSGNARKLSGKKLTHMWDTILTRTENSIKASGSDTSKDLDAASDAHTKRANSAPKLTTAGATVGQGNNKSRGKRKKRTLPTPPTSISDLSNPAQSRSSTTTPPPRPLGPKPEALTNNESGSADYEVDDSDDDDVYDDPEGIERPTVAQSNICKGNGDSYPDTSELYDMPESTEEASRPNLVTVEDTHVDEELYMKTKSLARRLKLQLNFLGEESRDYDDDVDDDSFDTVKTGNDNTSNKVNGDEDEYIEVSDRERAELSSTIGFAWLPRRYPEAVVSSAPEFSNRRLSKGPVCNESASDSSEWESIEDDSWDDSDESDNEVSWPNVASLPGPSPEVLDDTSARQNLPSILKPKCKPKVLPKPGASRRRKTRKKRAPTLPVGPPPRLTPRSRTPPPLPSNPPPASDSDTKLSAAEKARLKREKERADAKRRREARLAKKYQQPSSNRVNSATKAPVSTDEGEYIEPVCDWEVDQESLYDTRTVATLGAEQIDSGHSAGSETNNDTNNLDRLFDKLEESQRSRLDRQRSSGDTSVSPIDQLPGPSPALFLLRDNEEKELQPSDAVRPSVRRRQVPWQPNPVLKAKTRKADSYPEASEKNSNRAFKIGHDYRTAPVTRHEGGHDYRGVDLKNGNVQCNVTEVEDLQDEYAVAKQAPSPVPWDKRSYYHGKIARDKAEQLLNSVSSALPEGLFLLRKSPNAKMPVVSFVLDGRIRHSRILKGSQGYCLGDDPTVFKCIEDLLGKHSLLKFSLKPIESRC